MFSTENQRELQKLLKEFTKSNGYAFCCGYYEIMLVDYFNSLKKRDQKWELERLARELARCQQGCQTVDKTVV